MHRAERERRSGERAVGPDSIARDQREPDAEQQADQRDDRNDGLRRTLTRGGPGGTIGGTIRSIGGGASRCRGPGRRAEDRAGGGNSTAEYRGAGGQGSGVGTSISLATNEPRPR
jgi:hypothetical protein